jgi:ParB family chromosome partitioning protein
MEQEFISLVDIVEKDNIRTETGVGVAPLMESIKQHGLLQPIVVYKNAVGKFVIVMGHRRLNAIRKLMWEKLEVGRQILVFPDELTTKKFLLLNTTENVQREDIAPMELGKMVSKFREEFAMNVDEVAASLSIPKGRVQDALEVYQRAPEEFRSVIGWRDDRNSTKNRDKISPSLLKTILGLKLTKAMTHELITLAKKESMTTSQVNILSRIIEASGKDVSIKDAYEIMEKYKPITIALVVSRKEAKEIVEENKMPLGKYLVKVLKKHEGRLVF